MTPFNMMDCRFLFIIFAILFNRVAGANYPVPNPFSYESRDFYAIESIQEWSRPASNYVYHVSVTEFVNLHEGKFFSINQQISDKFETIGQPFALISDANGGRMFKVQNLDNTERFSCEIDLTHWNHDASPWEFEWPISMFGNVGKAFGVSGIWLTAIEDNLMSSPDFMGDDKFFDEHNVWQKIISAKSEYILGFPKSPSDNEEIVRKTILKRGKVIRYNITMNDPDAGSTNHHPMEVQSFVIKSFLQKVKGKDVKNVQLRDLIAAEQRCIESNPTSRPIFPSLQRAISKSTYGNYHITYLMRRHGSPFKKEHENYDEVEQRVIYNLEKHTEFFRFHDAFEWRKVSDASRAFGFHGDHYYKLFTNGHEYDPKTGFGTLSYHHNEDKLTCQQGEREWNYTIPAMKRLMHFHKENDDKLYSGYLNGIGALLLNVATINPSKLRYESGAFYENIHRWHAFLKADKRSLIHVEFTFSNSEWDDVEIQDLKQISVEIGDKLLLEFYDIRFTFIFDDPTKYTNLIPKFCTEITPKPYNEDVDGSGDEDDIIEPEPMKPDEPSDFEPDVMQATGGYFPSIYDFLTFSGSNSYSFESRIVRSQGNNEAYLEADDAVRSMKVRDSFVLESGLTAIEFVYTNTSLRDKSDDIIIMDYESEMVFKLSSDKNSCTRGSPAIIDRIFRLISADVKYVSEHGDMSIESNELRSYGVGGLWRMASESKQLQFIGKINQNEPILINNTAYDKYVWQISQLSDITIGYEFLFNVTMLDEYRTQIAINSTQWRRRTREDFYTLNKITFKGPQDTDSPSVEMIVDSSSFGIRHKFDYLAACKKVIDVARDDANAKLNSTLPYIEEYVKPMDNYEATYELKFDWLKVRKEPENDDENDYENEHKNDRNHFDHVLAYRKVREIYDERKKLGIIEMTDLSASDGSKLSNEPERVVYINATSGLMLYYRRSSNVCQELLNTRMIYGPFGSHLSSNRNFRRNPFGLREFWFKLSGKKARVESRYERDAMNVPSLVKEYIIEDTLYSDRVEMTFVVDFSIDDNDEQPNGGLLKLDTIDCINSWPNAHSHIKVESISPLPNNLPASFWRLPTACQNPISFFVDPRADLPFPNIKTILGQDNEARFIHLKAEMVSSLDTVEGHNRFIIDEYHKDPFYRLVAQSLPFDLHLDTELGQIFDLSKPNNCSFKLPALFPFNNLDDTSNQLVEFWRSKLAVKRPSDLYYAPIALWQMASRENANIEYIMPDGPIVDEEDPLSLPRRAKWILRSGDKGNDKPPFEWQITFSFTTNSSTNVNNPGYTLDSIEISDPEVTLTGSLDNKFVLDIIYYHIDIEEHDEEMFHVPAGAGCLTNADDPKKSYFDGQIEELALDSTRPSEWYYRASLNLANKHWMPIIAGKFMTSGESIPSPTSWPQMDAWSTKFLRYDGQFVSRLNVVDRTNSVSHILDRDSGICNIDSKLMPWTLHFYHPTDGLIDIQLHEQTFQMLFGGTAKQNYSLIYKQKNDDDNKTVKYAQYEKVVAHYELSALSSLPAGPMSIVRTFTGSNRINSFFDSKTSLLVTEYDQMSIDALVFNENRSKMVAKLTIDIGPVEFMDDELSSLIEFCSIGQSCTNNNEKTMANFKAKRTLEVHYQMEPADMSRPLNVAKILNDFSLLLLNPQSKIGLLISQFVGSPRISHLPSSSPRASEMEKLLSIQVDLIDPPTSIDYFTQFKDRTMDRELATISLSKLAPSQDDCSAWCDLLECAAVSYSFKTSLCRLITLQMIIGAKVATNETTARRRLVEFVDREVASIYAVEPIAMASRPPKVDHLIKLAEKSTEMFNFESMMRHLNAVEVKDLTGGFAELDGTSKGERSEDEVEPLVGPNDQIFRVYERDFKLVDFDRVLTYKSEVEDKDNLGACLAGCTGSSDCLLISHCKTHQCIRLKGKGVDLNWAKTKFMEHESDCIMMTRDFLAGYTIFEDHRKPSNWTNMLDNYSELECASACGGFERDGSEAYSCLSFDYCLIGDKSTCYLQKSHIMDQTNEGKLDPATIDSDIKCKHFSKSIIADYDRVPNTKLLDEIPRNSDDFVISDAYSVANVERCALNCWRDDYCWAFEFCFDKVEQKCRQIAHTEATNKKLIEWSKDIIEKQTNTSELCSIYKLNHNKPVYVSPDDANGGGRKPLPLWSLHAMSAIVLIITGIIGGLLLQFVFIRRTHHPITFQHVKPRCLP